MEEIEVPLEQAHEQIHEAAHSTKSRWISLSALSSALFAVLAAVSALMAGHSANEGMVSQIKAANSWNYYQAKGVKLAVLQSKVQLLGEMGKPTTEDDVKKTEQYKTDQEKIMEEAKTLENESAHHLHVHEIFAKAVTLFQVAIALSAIAALTRRHVLVMVSMGFAVVGLGFLTQAFLAL